MLGIYISVPFCKSKCSYCNFASGVFGQDRVEKYVETLIRDIEHTEENVAELGAVCERQVDSVYLGGGTPTSLSAKHLDRIFSAIGKTFQVSSEAEITVECAPGTLSAEMLSVLTASGVNRVSLGVQSFQDIEARSVGRLHTREITLRDIEALRHAGVTNLSIDLIAGLPHQTRSSWDDTLATVILTNVPHASVYMLEVDEDSRLGRELIAGGRRYHAHHVPNEDLCAELYETAVDVLEDAGIKQYEISNFARLGYESRHNLKYWTRQPYLGFGMDAHSMLPKSNPADAVAVRFSRCDDFERYIAGAGFISSEVTSREALEEELFLGLRLNHGVSLAEISSKTGGELPETVLAALNAAIADGLLVRIGSSLTLTEKGRLLSNEVFARLLDDKVAIPG